MNTKKQTEPAVAVVIKSNSEIIRNHPVIGVVFDLSSKLNNTRVAYDEKGNTIRLERSLWST